MDFAGESIINKTIKNYHEKSVQFLLLFLMCISASWTWASDAPERTVLFNMGDYDSQYWRIPALVTAADNSLVAVVDKRGSSLGRPAQYDFHYVEKKYR